MYHKTKSYYSLHFLIINYFIIIAIKTHDKRKSKRLRWNTMKSRFPSTQYYLPLQNHPLSQLLERGIPEISNS